MAGSAAHRLAVESLTLARGPRRLFSHLSWSLAAGEAMVLRGANGSGKTSLLRVLAGLTAADEGAVHWNGAPWRPLSASQRATCLYLGHANALKDDLTVAENLADALAFDGVHADAAAMTAALDASGLGGRHHLHARRLSQGQKRRVGLARLSLSAKPVWLLDEPTNALDDAGVALFTALLERHLRAGGLACVATHLPLTLDGRVHELSLGGAS